MSGLIGLIGGDGDLTLFRSEGESYLETDQVSGGGPRGRDAVVFVPAVDVSVHRVSLPARNERDARRAAPFAIEDDIAQSPDEIHIAFGPQDVDQMRTVYAVDVDVMAEWVETLERAGLAEAALVAPQALLPAGDALIRAETTVYGSIRGRTFALDEPAPDTLIAGLTQSSSDLIEYDFRGQTPLYLQQLETWGKGRSEANLRQGTFAARRPVDMGRLKRWRLVGALAAALGVTWIGAQIWSVQNTRALTASLNQRAVEVVQAGWPELNGDVERALTEVRAQGAGGGLAFPAALTATAALYEAIAGVEGSELRSMRYDRSRQQVLAIVAYPDFGDGERLASAFDESGLRARVGDARQSGRQVIAELVLEIGS